MYLQDNFLFDIDGRKLFYSVNVQQEPRRLTATLTTYPSVDTGAGTSDGIQQWITQKNYNQQAIPSEVSNMRKVIVNMEIYAIPPEVSNMRKVTVNMEIYPWGYIH